jgi:hypothetical protein
MFLEEEGKSEEKIKYTPGHRALNASEPAHSGSQEPRITKGGKIK